MTWLEKYATAVLDGKIIACARIKQQYEKLLNDLHFPQEWHFDEDIANRHINFIETFCKQSQGDIGAPLKLELFQKAKFQAIFGFVDDNDIRRYNEAFTIEGRKNGKTTEVAAISLDLLVNDFEGAPEIYFIATKRDQALKGFNEAWNMVKQSPHLKKHITKRRKDLYFRHSLGTIEPLASNTNSLDGLNAHAVFVDELSAIKNRDVYDLMKQSMGSRLQPLLFTISTNGFVRENIFDAQYDYACGVLDGTIKDDRFLAFIYELDDRNEWTDPEMWIKANPGLGTIKSTEYLQACVDKAKVDPSFRATVLVKDFNLKENSSTASLRWEDLNNETVAPFAFDYGIGGFDAADTTDLNAAVAIGVKQGDPNIYVESMFWIPETVLELTGKTGSRRERDNLPYELWVKQGLMRTFPGHKVEKQVFLDWFLELRETKEFYTLYFGYDPWHIDESLQTQFRNYFGQNCMIPVRQGAITLSDPLKEMKADLAAKKIIYQNNPVMKACLTNLSEKADINGNIQPVKKLDPRERIDGAIALLCGYKVLKDKQDEIEMLNGISS